MLKKISNRMVAVTVAFIMILASVPISVFTLADDFTAENLIQNGSLQSTQVILMSTSNSTEIGDGSGRVSKAGVAAINEGNKGGNYTYIMDALGWNPPKYVGLTYTFTQSFYIGEVLIDAGYESREELYDIYASDDLGTLYLQDSKIVSELSCLNGVSKAEINLKAKYISIVNTSCKDGGMRIKKIKIMSGDESEIPETFTPENLIGSSHMTVSKAIQMLASDASQVTDDNGNRVNAEGIANIVAGNPNGGYTYVMDALGWNPKKYIGLTFGFDDSFYIGNAVIDAGYESREELYNVYASNSEAALYSNDSLIAMGVEVIDGPVTVPVNRKVKYISFVCTSCKDGGMRIKQIKAVTAEETQGFSSENLLITKLEETNLKHMSMNNGSVSDGTKFGENGALEIINDGDITINKPVYDCINGWEYPIYPGVVYALSDPAYAGNLRIYASGAVTVYASESYDDLYREESLIADKEAVSLEGTEFTVNRKVKYLAVFCVGFSDMSEIELWSAEDPAADDDNQDEYDTTVAENGKKVLTIGNSFSENASEFATAIAADQGYDLLFGYLKYPSCTIEQHIQNAESNSALYKFEYTSAKGRFTVKNGVNNFASVAEALRFTDWDIVVVQQGSAVSDDIASYANIGKLVSYIKDFCPDVQIMLHETWSWGSWSENNHSRCKNIVAANYVVSKEYLNGAKIIHSGLAIENARTEYNDHLMFNDNDDGKYQHLNDLGKFIAGLTYVETIFGCDVQNNNFSDSESLKPIDLAKLRTIVHKAVSETDVAALYKDEIAAIYDKLNATPDNFIARHLESYSTIIMDKANGSVDNHDHFNGSVKNSGSSVTAAELAIDGDAATTFGVWGAGDWNPPKYVGVSYALDAVYMIDSALLYAGDASSVVTIDVYTSDVGGTHIYEEKNLVGRNIKCNGGKATVKINREISFVAFIITGFTSEGNTAHIAEFDLVGNELSIPKPVFSWPAVPDSGNILKNAAAAEIIAPGGDFKSTKEYDYRFMDYKTETQLNKLTDGDISKHYDIWSLRENDLPGVLYDLGAFYDLTHLHAWAGVMDSELYTVNGYRIYASDSLSTLYSSKNLVFEHENEKDTTNEIGANVNLSKIRYIAFIITKESGGWKLREFAAYGTKSADQSVPAERKSILEGIDAEYYGVATDNLADPIYNGASAPVGALVDNKRENVEFWGGSDVNNSCFVFIYNLYANYDLSSIEIFANADTMDQEFGIHKGIRSAKVYAARRFTDLFTSSPIVLKEDYASKTEADEESSFEAAARSDWKAVRYIAYVFTIGDTKYGACRLEELKAYGTLSPVQDAEEAEAKLPYYIDVTADNGVIARIYQLNDTDDLTKLNAALTSESESTGKIVDFVNSSLKGYKADKVYTVTVTDGNGNPLKTDNRLIRLSIPNENSKHLVACVDDFGAEIVSNGLLNDFITVETETLRSYALVLPEKEKSSHAANGVLIWALVATLGVFAVSGIGFTIFNAVKMKKN